MNQIGPNHNEGIFFLLCPFLLSLPNPINMKDSSPADPTFHLEEITLSAIKLWQYQKIIPGCRQAKEEVMNIIEALSDFALSSKWSFSGRVSCETE